MSYQEPKIWTPALFPKQVEIFNCYKHFVLASGPRRSGKTLGVIHRVVRHLWETPGAVVGVFSKILRTAKDTGVWQDFLNIVLPEWMGRELDAEGNEVYVPKLYNKYGQPFEFTTIDSKGTAGAKSDSVTRSMYFKVRNYWGGESKLLLFSLDNENEATARLKQTRFSMIYVPELSEFKTDVMYKHGSQQLRVGDFRNQQWIADTNPSEEGEESWIYDLFYTQRTAENSKEPLVQKELALIEIFLEDNPTLSEFDIASLRQAYSADEGEYQRNVNGLWVKGHGKIGRVFADLFAHEIHVIKDFIDIAITQSEFFGGFDLGDTHHAAVMVERRRVMDNGVEKSLWLVFEELVVLDQQVSTKDFTEMYVDKLREIEAFYGRKIPFVKFWSDDSSIVKYRASSDTYEYLVVREASNGEIDLEGVQKTSGSVSARVRVMRQLLQENRIFVGENCQATIDMFTNMMRGGDKPISKESKHRHIHDAISYIILQETMGEMDLSGRPQSRPDQLVSV